MNKTNELINESIAVLGSSGSVGRQALEVAALHGTPVRMISVRSSVDSAEEQIRRFSPKICSVTDEVAARELAIRVADTGTKIVSGEEGLLDSIAGCGAHTVVNSILGMAGLRPSLAAVSSGARRLALSNKESMVIAGEIVRREAKAHDCAILPVDSEHCAIHQCLGAGRHCDVKALVLTASGGPFFGYSKEKLRGVTLEETLDHPTWKMGAKITVDSATLMNKGFEVIEAVRLFDIPAEKIKVVVHRESIMHSAVEYIDNMIIAQLGIPDMRACVQYALTYPTRIEGLTPPLDFASLGKMTFADPDRDAFPLLDTAYRAVSIGGATPAVLNASNEIAVAAFLDRRISFCEISELVSGVTDRLSARAASAETLEEILGFDAEAREITAELIGRK